MQRRIGDGSIGEAWLIVGMPSGRSAATRRDP
jgi:hypothetical protein